MESDEYISVAERLEKLPFLEKIDYVHSILEEDTTEELLNQIAIHPSIKEVAFNVIDSYLFQAKSGGVQEDILKRCIKFGEMRMNYLKDSFAGKPAGRNMPGKMEYDTTLDSVRELKRFMGE